ncbi:MAG: hypothetical protein A2000_01790 [Ignavibacteria bacterium GWB2_36_8]|nr:MAG: hypothetical protein A2000_01790 [Ignavibacteria bacterium GWB2_36_8]
MKFFEYKPIRSKLKLVIISTCVLTVILVFAGFFTYEYVTFKKILIDDLSTKADLIAENSNAALTFRDYTDATRILNSLVSQPHITAAAIYDKNKTIFASYTREGQEEVFPAKPLSSDTSLFNDDAIVVYKAIILSGEQIGTLYLSKDLASQKQRFWSYLEIALLVLIGSLTAAYVVANILAKNISAPIISLAETSKKVSQQKDYSIRAAKISNDETGFLADSFNQMLVQIQERDADLHKTYETIQDAEKRYRTTLDHMLEGCQIIGFDWKYLYLNDVAIKHSRSTKEELIGKTMMDVYPGIENTEMFQYMNLCMKERTPNQMENKFVYPDGEKKWFTLSIEPVPEGIFILSEDITERKKLQEELNKHHEQLEELVKDRTSQLEAANKDMESFSYSVSHDLRAPLRAVSGYARMLEQDYSNLLDKEGNRLLGVIQSNAKTMGSLIDDLLALSRLGRKEIRKSLIDMTKLTKTVLQEINKITSNNAEVKINKLHPVMADNSLMSQVMTNLLSNAIKYSSKKEKPVVKISSEEKDGQFIYSVSDNGAGFDMQYAQKLFGVFQRLHASHEFEGTGVGLAIVHLLIRKHGGNVWAEGEVNKGATFYFSLPAERAG